MKKLLFTPIFFFAFLILAQAQDGKVYRADNVESLIAKHKSFAILPFDINYTERSNKKNKLTPENVEQMKEDMAFETQRAMYGYTLKKKKKGNLAVMPQDIDVTNAKLLKADITHETIKEYTPQELCELLEVDAILNGTLSVKETMSQGAAVVTTVLIGGSKTNSGLGQIKLTDADGELLFNYNKKVATGLGGDATDIIDKLMKKSANRFPYFTKSGNLLK